MKLSIQDESQRKLIKTLHH